MGEPQTKRRLSPWGRIVRAHYRKTGIRLSVAEVERLAQDDSIWDLGHLELQEEGFDHLWDEKKQAEEGGDGE